MDNGTLPTSTSSWTVTPDSVVPSVQLSGLNGPVTLTPREQDTLRLMAAGLTNKLIGLALHISDHTAKFHVQNLLKKLGVDNRAQAAVLAVRAGLA